MKTTKLSIVATLVLTGNTLLYAGSEGNAQQNVFYGNNAGLSLTPGASFNVFLGEYAGRDTNGGSYNTFTGIFSGFKNTEGSRNTFNGAFSGSRNTEGDKNTFNGYSSGSKNTTGHSNTFNGYESGRNNTTGSYNIFNGRGSGYKNTTGSYNIFTGLNAGYANTTGNANTIIGVDAGRTTNIHNSVLLGRHAGYFADRNNTLYISNSATHSPLIYGEFDTPVLVINGELNTTKAVSTKINVNNNKSLQTAFSMAANNSNSDEKSDVGFTLRNTRENFSWAFRTFEPDNSFAISKQNSGAKELRIIGLDEPNGMQLILGNGASNTGGQWLDASSRKYKENIQTLDSKTAMEAFHKLKPVTYNYKTNKAEPIVGFIAEDVPDVVATNKRDALSALEMVALLTKVVQVQNEKLELEKKKIKKLEIQNEKFELQMETLLNSLSLNKQKNNKVY